MSTTPPAGHTWDGTVADVAARISTRGDGRDWQRFASARALGAISALARNGGPLGATDDQRLALIARILDALDLVEQQHGARPAKEN